MRPQNGRGKRNSDATANEEAVAGNHARVRHRTREEHHRATNCETRRAEGKEKEEHSTTSVCSPLKDHAAYHRTRHRGSRPTDLRHDAELENTDKVEKVAAACPVVVVPAGAWVSRPPVLGLVVLAELPACETTPWSQHSHDAAGTSTRNVRTRSTWDFALTGARCWVSWFGNASSAP